MEVSVQSMSMTASLAKRIAQHGGAALIIDYGQDRLLEQSLQAIKKHKFVHPLSLPGEADLSCHVDFSALRQASLRLHHSEHAMLRDQSQYNLKSIEISILLCTAAHNLPRVMT